MAKRKTDQTPITETPPQPVAKHHEPQALARVEVIRGRVQRLMVSALGNVRSMMSCIPGNEEAVERLRGKSGEGVLHRVCDFVMMELGDTATALETGGDRSRAFSRRVKGAMGPASDDIEADDDGTQAA